MKPEQEQIFDEQYDFVIKLHSDQEITKAEKEFALNFIGNSKAFISGCNCRRPSSCGTCRTTQEDASYWIEKKSELQDEVDYDDI